MGAALPITLLVSCMNFPPESQRRPPKGRRREGVLCRSCADKLHEHADSTDTASRALYLAQNPPRFAPVGRTAGKCCFDLQATLGVEPLIFRSEARQILYAGETMARSVLGKAVNKLGQYGRIRHERNPSATGSSGPDWRLH